MKRSLLRFLSFGVLALAAGTNADAQYWNLTGNNNAVSGSILGTTNAVPLSLYTKNSARLSIDTLGRVGIGTTNPGNIFTVRGLGSSVPASVWVPTGSPIVTSFSEGALGNGDFIHATASNIVNTRAVFIGRRAKGTLAAPLALAYNDPVTSFYGSGYDGTGFQNAAGIDFICDGTPSAGSLPTRISFSTGANGSTLTERLKITYGGNFFFNNSQLTLNNATGDVNIGKGMMFFNNISQTVQFSSAAASTGVVKPMLTMLPASNTAFSRMVIAPSSTGVGMNYGLKYTQTNDSAATWEFLGSRGSVLKIEPIKKYVTISDSLGTGRVIAAYNGALSTVTGNNVGSGYGVYGYSAGKNSYQSIGVFGKAADQGAGVHGESVRGGGVDGYSVNNVGLGGTSENLYGVYGINLNGASYAGYFDGDIYCETLYQTSDGKLKKNVTDLTGGMDIISRLKPKTYEFKHDGAYAAMRLPQGKKYGLIAQDIEEVLPNIVKQSSFNPALAKSRSGSNTAEATDEKIDFKAVNYTELIPIIIKGMQEQNAVIEDQKAKIDSKDKEIQDIKSELEQLKNILISKGVLDGKEISQSRVKLSNDASLDQNVPNPPVNNATAISYNIPKNTVKSEIVFTDITGKRVKQIAINNTGKGVLNVDTAGLTPGTYTYTLYVDGRMAETKTMVVTTK